MLRDVQALASFREGSWLCGVHSLPRVNVVENHVGRSGQRGVKEALSNHLRLLLVLVVYARVLLVVKRDAFSLDEVVVEVNWQHLWVWDDLLVVFWQDLVVNIVSRLLYVV